MRKNLTIEDLGTLLEDPRVAVIATLRDDGSVLLSPVWHEWRDGGFNVWIIVNDVKHRHLQRDPRLSIVVAESEPPLRGVEARGTAKLIHEGVTDAAIRIGTRYIGPEEAADYAESMRDKDLIVRLDPEHVRVWDFADDF